MKWLKWLMGLVLIGAASLLFYVWLLRDPAL
jgi:hypothetical protein